MDDVVRARDAAREALADIEPDRLRAVLEDRLTDASMAPGVLALRSAHALDGGANLDAVAERAAGVQLIYEGLRLTRTLAHEEPWLHAESRTDGTGRPADRLTDGERRDRPARINGDGRIDDLDDGRIDDLDGVGGTGDPGGVNADLDILAADVLVSRGFYLLARTEAADRAVETVRAFGRDQTRRRDAATDDEAEALDRNLEADVFALAVVAGTTAVGRDPPAQLLEFAGDLARGEAEGRDLAPAAVSLADATAERILALSTGGDDRVPSSATDS